MAVTVDNTVARVSNDGGSAVTSGTFNVAVDDLIIICGNLDEDNDGSSNNFVVSDNNTPDLTFTLISDRGATESGAGYVANYYHRVTDAITGLTVTLTRNVLAGGSDSPSIKIYKATGYDTADIVGAINEGNLTTDPQTTTAITSETAGAFFANWTDWNQTGTPTSSDLTVAGFDTSGDISGGSGYKAIGSAASSVTGNINSGGTPTGNWTVFEIRAAAGASTTRGTPFGHRSTAFNGGRTFLGNIR